tara:strand:- start:452 stop:754 length:303 start_codon:yes stop_codon:yes gene_type:complete
MERYEMSDEILLKLATALREVKGMTPLCTVDLFDEDTHIGAVTWNQDHLIIRDKDRNIEKVVGLVELDKDSREFLEACLRLWLVQEEGVAKQWNLTRAEA